MGTAVHVYSARLEPDAARLDCLHEILSPEERERAARFYFPIHRQHFIACRGMLREILAGYLEMAPAQVRFSYNAYGKPAVQEGGADPLVRSRPPGRLLRDGGVPRGPGGPPHLRFNVSHSGGWALFAVTQGREVGIDIERIEARVAQEQIPEHFFSSWEVSQLRALPAAQQTDAFFRCWTRKEAYIKARGLGLSLPLDSFDVSLAPGEPAALLRGAGNYSLQELPAPEGFAAAVAAEGADWEVTLHGMVS